MAWQRLIFPDGKTLDIRAMPGADSAGYAGFSDQVNNHWFRTISSAILMSGVIAAVDLSQDNTTASVPATPSPKPSARLLVKSSAKSSPRTLTYPLHWKSDRAIVST